MKYSYITPTLKCDINGDNLAEQLNEWSEQGWRFRQIINQDYEDSLKEEFVLVTVLLEREAEKKSGLGEEPLAIM